MSVRRLLGLWCGLAIVAGCAVTEPERAVERVPEASERTTIVTPTPTPTPTPARAPTPGTPDPATPSPGSIATTPVETWLDLVPGEYETWAVSLSGGGQKPLNIDWPLPPDTAAGNQAFIDEVGFSYDSIETIGSVFSSEDERRFTVLATASDAEQSIAHILEHPHWGGLATVDDYGAWTVVDFGSAVNVAQRSELRPLGIGGALAYGPDGYVLWSSDPETVTETLGAAAPNPVAELTAAIADQWIEGARIAMIDAFSDENYPEEAAAFRAAAYSRDRTLRTYAWITVIRMSDSMTTVVLEHEFVEQAVVNAERFETVFRASPVTRVDEPPISDVVSIDSVERIDTVVVIELEEAVAGIVLDRLFATPAFSVNLQG